MSEFWNCNKSLELRQENSRKVCPLVSPERPGALTRSFVELCQEGDVAAIPPPLHSNVQMFKCCSSIPPPLHSNLFTLLHCTIHCTPSCYQNILRSWNLTILRSWHCPHPYFPSKLVFFSQAIAQINLDFYILSTFQLVSLEPQHSITFEDGENVLNIRP